ncbi:MAG: crossover junction endodeoxyribonuclease RuvC, partial [Candidatus Kapabacteria bacterium]|nr:crossover junction endodeoxyribonuclease RuvC [Candidatus Kapabacteria bacterium]
SRNAQSLAKLAQARGIVLLALALANLPIVEYSPREVKQSVTGRGNAAKEQVRYMVQALLGLPAAPRFYDISDALAVALCHAFRRSRILDGGTPRTWAEFVRRFPGRVLNP